MRDLALYSFFFLGPLTALADGPPTDWCQYALTDTGSIGGGNTFPGVSRPFGMVKLGPDVNSGKDAYSGYQPSGKITGFSMLHESGTGGAPKYGVVSQMPIIGSVENPLSDSMYDNRTTPDYTEVGYYRTSLASGTVVEMTASRRSAMYQYTFPPPKSGYNILIDVSHVLASYRGQGLEQRYLGGNITVQQQSPNGPSYYTGWGTYDNGWNRAAPWKVYFCGRFNAPFTYMTFLGTKKDGNDLRDYSTKPSHESRTARLGAVFTFNTTSVTSRVGVSFRSTDQACANIDAEIPETLSPIALRQQTRDVWNADVFRKVVTTETNTTKLQQLYTALYFSHLLPTNKTGENPLWDSAEPYYDDIFTFWDTYRCLTPLLHILQPKSYEELLRSMVDIWRHQGWAPDARSSFFNGAVQGGSNSDMIFADAYVKGVRGRVNWNDAFASMKKNADVVPQKTDDPRDKTGSTKEGRGALPDWLEHGFITTKFTRSVSRAMEYSVNDFSLALVAAGLGLRDDFLQYTERSRNWRKHWNKDMQALGFSGFVGPRNEEGFIEQDPLSCGGCYWQDHYYEALPWEYTFNAHHDLHHLIVLCGGPSAFVDRLEMSFKPGVYTAGNEQFGHTLLNPGNEPSFATPYLYNYVNRQDLSVKRSRFIAKSYFAPKPDGLPGNSDAGAMESWLLWNMIGLYPMTGQPIFLIGSPWFANLTIDLGYGNQLTVTTTGGDEQNFYVQSLWVNGRPWDKGWLTWNDIFENGGTLDFVLGANPANWTTGPLPPNWTRLDFEKVGKLLGKKDFQRVAAESSTATQNSNFVRTLRRSLSVR